MENREINTDKLILDSLNRINDKLDVHDNKFDQISITLKKLVEVDMEMKELKSANKRLFTRLENVEQNQVTDGCPALKNYWKIRTEQLKKYDRIVDDFDERISDNEYSIKTLKDIPNKIIMRMIMVAAGTITAAIIGAEFVDKFKG